MNPGAERGVRRLVRAVPAILRQSRSCIDVLPRLRGDRRTRDPPDDPRADTRSLPRLDARPDARRRQADQRIADGRDRGCGLRWVVPRHPARGEAFLSEGLASRFPTRFSRRSSSRTSSARPSGGGARRSPLARPAREHITRLCGASSRGSGAQELDTAGDGFFATFDGPARAIRCARGDRRRCPRARARRACRVAHRRVRAARGQARRDRRHRSGRGSPALAGPGEVLVSQHRQGPRRGLGDRVRGSRHARAEGRAGRVEALCRRARPETRYAKSGDLNIAYQVVGDGPLDLIYVPGWISNVELNWEEPALAHVLERLASFSRLILFDKRGTGLSDPVPLDRLPTLEERMDDVRAVLDAVGCRAGRALRLLRGRPDERSLRRDLSRAHHGARRSSASSRSGIWSPDYPWAPKPDDREREIAELERNWSERMDLDELAPSEDDAFKDRLATYFRRSASPGAAAALMRMNTQLDVRDVLPAIQVPTLVLHRDGRSRRERGGRPLDRRADSRREVRRAARGRAHALGGEHRRGPRRDRGVPDRRPARARAGPRARDGALHRHRRLDRAGGEARRPPLAGAARAAPCARAAAARALPRARGGHGRRRLPRHVRRPGACDPLRARRS